MKNYKVFRAGVHLARRKEWHFTRQEMALAVLTMMMACPTWNVLFDPIIECP